MLVVVSPAKKLNESATTDLGLTQPTFTEETELLTQRAQTLSKAELMKLMSISESLAELNHARFAEFAALPEGPAALMFAGDTYTGLDAPSMSSDELRGAQDYLRILSGLYGLLRPLDAIRPYRLEMGSRLATERGKNL